MFYADASYCVTPKVKLTAAFASQNNTKGKSGNDINDYTLQVDYAYSKKLSFQAYYDYADVDAKDADNTEVRAQALYKF